MTRLIDADAVIKYIEEYWEMVKRGKPSRGMTAVMQNIKTIVNSLPTVDAVQHGKWINANEGRWNTCEVLKCSECGELDNRMYKTDKYCPNCGARMDEE